MQLEYVEDETGFASRCAERSFNTATETSPLTVGETLISSAVSGNRYSMPSNGTSADFAMVLFIISFLAAGAASK
jgi:hypothetical protein